MSGRRLGDKWLIFNEKTGRIDCRLLFRSYQEAYSYAKLLKGSAVRVARKVQIREAK